MGSYSLFYKGPSLTDDPPRAERIADALAARLPFSREEALNRLEETPFVLVAGFEENKAQRLLLFLKAMGADIELMEDAEEFRKVPQPSSVTAPARTGQWCTRGAFKPVVNIVATGLLIVFFIFLAGVVQIIASRMIRIGEESFWALSATGWLTLAFSIFLLIGLTVIRLPRIISVIKSPDLSTPLKTLNSYLTAINARHWQKALACLGVTGEADKPGKAAGLAYFKKLAALYILPERIDSRDVVIFEYTENRAELRFHIPMIARKSLADGTRMQRVLVEVSRFSNINGRWYLVDGLLFGQKIPERLPIPGCRTCGEETDTGSRECSACRASLPPVAVSSEKWLPPQRNPNLAALFSALFPGLGQAYNNQPLKGALIALTFWMVLPWLAGVIDAVIVADRINRNRSSHTLSAKPLTYMLLHAAAFIALAVIVVYNVETIPLLDEISRARNASQAVVNEASVVGRFRGPDGKYSVLFPRRWTVEELPVEAGGSPELPTIVQASSPDNRSRIVIRAGAMPENWQPCNEASETRRRLEMQGEEVANFECGSRDGREQYRLDSYTADRQWRRSLIVVVAEHELVIIAFVCPTEQQSEMVGTFESVARSIRFAQEVDTSILK